MNSRIFFYNWLKSIKINFQFLNYVFSKINIKSLPKIFNFLFIKIIKLIFEDYGENVWESLESRVGRNELQYDDDDYYY